MVCFKWVRTTTRCRGVGVLMIFHLFVVGGVVVLAVDVVGWQIFVFTSDLRRQSMPFEVIFS